MKEFILRKQNRLFKHLALLKISQTCRGVFTTLSNIYDGAIGKIDNKAINYFRKTPHLRCLVRA